MLHNNYVTFQTQIKTTTGLAAADVDLAAMMIEEEAAAAAAGSMGKKEKRLLKKQQQQLKSKAKKVVEASDEEDDDWEDDQEMGDEEEVAVPVEESDEEDDEEAIVQDEEIKETESNDPVKCIKAFKRLVVQTLEENQMQDKRACKMEIIDFLNLLNIFNKKDIHFK